MNYKNEKNRGVAALEFALIFPVLFLMIYALLCYSMIFAVQHALNLAAAEGARASVRFKTSDDSIGDREDAACMAITESLSWLKDMGVVVNCEGDGGNGLFVDINPYSNNLNKNIAEFYINIDFNYKQYPIIPPLMLPVPANIKSHAVSQFSLKF